VTTTAVLLATAEAHDGLPAAMLAWRGGTVVGHLIEQLAQLGVTAVHVVTRPAWARQVGAALDGSRVPATISADPDLAADLRTIARVARSGDGPLLVAQAEMLTHGQALAGLLSDPRVATGILVTTGRAGGELASGVRIARGRVVAAGSPLHAVTAPTAAFLGALKVAPADREALATQNERMAALVGELARQRPGAPEDAVALSVVGLVRAPVTVGATYLRGMYWARPFSADELAAAGAELDAIDEDDALLDAAVKATDGFFTTFFVSPYSRYVARWAARRGLTPNLVTTVSLLVGIVAAAAFALGDRAGLVAGAVLLQVAFMLDCVDGQLARYTRQFSKFGAWLDSIFDRTKEYAVFAGLAIGAAHTGDPVWLLAGAALALQVTRHTLDFSWAASEHRHLAALPALALDDLGEATDEDAVAPAEAAAARTGPAATVWRTWRRLDRSATAVWIKRVIQFPIGERFAVISIVAAIWDARAVFVVLLAWGGVAGAYALGGRLLRMVRRRGGLASLDWLVPVLLRAGEYGALLAIAAAAGPSSEPAVFALLAAIAFHHYDLVYRLRHRNETPPTWLRVVALGAGGRVALAAVLLAVGALPLGFYVWSGLLAVVFVGESAVVWARPRPTRTSPCS